MVNNTIKQFKDKHTGFRFNEFLYSFSEGVTLQGLVEEYNVTELPLRKFVYSLGLEFAKKKRQSSVEELRYRIELEKGGDFDIVRALEADIEALSTKNRKLYQSLTLTRDENNALRKEARKEVREESLEDTLLTTW